MPTLTRASSMAGRRFTTLLLCADKGNLTPPLLLTIEYVHKHRAGIVDADIVTEPQKYERLVSIEQIPRMALLGKFDEYDFTYTQLSRAGDHEQTPMRPVTRRLSQ